MPRSQTFYQFPPAILRPKIVKNLNKTATYLIALHWKKKNDYGMASSKTYSTTTAIEQ